MRTMPKGAIRVIRCGLPEREAGRLLLLINRWLKASGPEWTTARLKAMREAAYQLRVGNVDQVKLIYQANSISYNHRSLLPKGAFKTIVSGYVSAMKPSVIRKYDAMLRIYTCLRLSSVSQKQYSKVKRSINAPFNASHYDLTTFEIALRKLGNKWRKYLDNPVGPDGKVVIDLSKQSPTSSTHVEKTCLRGDSPIRDNAWGKHITSLWTSVYIPDALKCINPAEKLRSLLAGSGADTVYAGHIAFIQEGGCKGRVVAVPNTWLQLLMRPLHLSLDKLSQHVLPRNSVVHDQNSGAYFAMQSIENGQTIYCKDISSATDRFPRSLQKALLEGLGLGIYAEALEEISKAPWKVNTPIGGHETWSYSVGQPMGLYSSFPLFNITHCAFLGILRKMFGGDYRVLGDDVLIVGEDLSRVYTKFMKSFGVEFSEPKCIESSSIAEFAGFTAYKTNMGVTSHRPFKYSGRHGFGAAIPLLNSLGKGCRKLGPWYRKQLEVFNKTKSFRNPDLSPLLRCDKEPQEGVSLNSHRLGSLSNRLSYLLSYEPCSKLLECYEEQQIILLGQKEIVNEGFASANLNTRFSPGAHPDDATQREDGIVDTFRVQLSSDPLMNQIKRETELKESHHFT